MELNFRDKCNAIDVGSTVVKVIGALPTGREGNQYMPGGEGVCAFAPDESRFAWSCGLRKVVLIPWNRYKNCFRANGEHCMWGEGIRIGSATEGSDYMGKLPTSIQSQDREDWAGNHILTERVSIDCGFQVCCVAFGTGTPVGELLPTKRKYWTRFDFSKNLMLATGHINGRIRIWDPYTGELLLELTDHKYAVYSVAFAPDGSLRLASGSQDGMIKIWDLSDDGNMFKTLTDTVKTAVKSLTWSPDAKLLCSVGQKQKVLLWNMEEYRLHKRLHGHFNEVLSASFSPDGAMLATASCDTRVLIWDIATGNVQRVLNHIKPPPGVIYMAGANDHYVKGVSFSPNGCQVASSCVDGYLRIWDLTSDNEEPEAVGLGIADDGMLSCCYSPAGGTVAVSFESGSSVFYTSPPKVPTLLHICRMVVRKSLGSRKSDTLFIPRTLRNYIQYEEW